MKIAAAIILGILTLACFVCSYLHFKEKCFLLNNAYLYASEQKKATMNKKPYYKQSGMVFLLIGMMLFISLVEIIVETGWLFFLAIGITIVLIIYAIVSSIAIENSEKD